MTDPHPLSAEVSHGANIIIHRGRNFHVDVERIKTSIGKAGKTPLRLAAAALENNAYMAQKLE
eukprot:2316027-Amphidinium_carterae.1